MTREELAIRMRNVRDYDSESFQEVINLVIENQFFSEKDLAYMIRVSPDAIKNWRVGEIPHYGVRLPILRFIANRLHS